MGKGGIFKSSFVQKSMKDDCILPSDAISLLIDPRQPSAATAPTTSMKGTATGRVATIRGAARITESSR